MTVAVEPVTNATQEVRDLIAALDAELSAEYVAGNRHGLHLDQLFRPAVAFFLARANGRAVGCGGVAFDDRLAEVKRMYVRPDARGNGVARAILAQLEHEARTRGHASLVLETGDAQRAAIRLYERSGFRRRTAFGKYAQMPPAAVARCVFYEKSIA